MAGFDKESIRSETLPLMTLVDAGNVAQRGLEKRLSHLHLSVAQQRILGLPSGYWDTYRAALAKVEPAEASALAKTLVAPKSFMVSASTMSPGTMMSTRSTGMPGMRDLAAAELWLN